MIELDIQAQEQAQNETNLIVYFILVIIFPINFIRTHNLTKYSQIIEDCVLTSSEPKA